MEKSNGRARMKISRKKTTYLRCNEHQYARDPFTGRDSKESEAIHMPGIDVGGGWRTGCGSHTHSAERMEGLEERGWSVVRHENERADLWEGVQEYGQW